MADFHLQGTYANRASSNTISVSAGYGVAVDALLVYFLVFDNTTATAPTVSSITKAPGETAAWQLLAKWDSPSASSGAGLRGEIWAIKATVTWPSSFPVTATLSASVGAQLGGLMDFANITPTIVSSGVVTSTSGGTSATSAGATPSIGDLAIGMAGWETNSDPSITVGGWTGWLNGTSGGGSAATHLRQSFAFSDVTTAMQQTYNPSGASVDSGAIVVVLKAGPPPLPTAGTVNAQSNGYAEAIYADVTPGKYANNGYNVYRDTGLPAPNQWELVNTMPPGSTRMWWDKWGFNSGNSSRGNVEVDARFLAHLGFSGINDTGEGPIASGAGLWTYARPRPATGWIAAPNPNGLAVDVTIPPLPYDAIAKIYRDGMLVGVPWVPANTSYVFTDDDQGLGLGRDTPMALVDTFTAPDGTVAVSHTADTGQSWTGTSGFTIVGNQLSQSTTWGDALYIPQPAPDGTFQADMLAWPRGGGLYFRYTPATQVGFVLTRDDTFGTTFELRGFTGTQYEPVVSKGASAPLGTDATVTVVMSGTSITVRISSDGYPDDVLTTTSAANATASGTMLGVKNPIGRVDNFAFSTTTYSYSGNWRADQTHYSQGWSTTVAVLGLAAQIQPETPKLFSACAYDADRIRLRWRKRAYPATYRIYRDGVLAHTTAQDETTWDDLDVVEGNSYSYEVSTVVGANESARTDPVVALCEAAIYIVPTGVQYWSTTGTPSSSSPYNGGTTSDGILATYHPSETSAAGSLYSYADQLVKYPGCLDTDTGLILSSTNATNVSGGNETGPLTQVLSLQAEIIANLPPNRVPVNFQLFRRGAGNDSGTQPNQTSTTSVGTYGATLTTSGVSGPGVAPSQQSVLTGAGETQVVMTSAEENFLVAKASSLQTDPNKRFKDKVNYQKWSWLGINLDLKSTASSVILASGSVTYSLYVRVGLGDPPPPAPAPTNFRFSYISGYTDLQMQWDTVPGYTAYLLSNDDGFFPETVVGNPPYRVMSVPTDKQGTTSTWSVRAKPLSDESSLAATLSVPYSLPEAPALAYSQMGLARGVRVFVQPTYPSSDLIEAVLERDGTVIYTNTTKTSGFYIDDTDLVVGQKYVYRGYYRAIADHSNVSHDIVPLDVWYGEEVSFSPTSDVSLGAGGTLVGGATFSSVVDEPWDSTSLSDYYDFPPTASTDVNVIAMLQMPPLTHPLGWIPREVYVMVGSALPPGAVAASDLYVRLVNPTSTPSAEQVMMPLGAAYSALGTWPADGLGFYMDQLATFLSTVVPAWWNGVRLKLQFSNQSYESDMRGLRAHNVKVNVVFAPAGAVASEFIGWGIAL